jgi:predicted ArsR family transcriptional regulator
LTVTATSRAAYHTPRRDGTQKQRILNALAEHGPLCDRELSELTGIPPNLVPPRRGELLAQGLIKFDTEEERGIEGRVVTVWRLNI